MKTTEIRFILKTTKRVYIALTHTVDEDIVYGHIEKNGESYGRLRNFRKEKIQFVK